MKTPAPQEVHVVGSTLVLPGRRLNSEIMEAHEAVMAVPTVATFDVSVHSKLIGRVVRQGRHYLGTYGGNGGGQPIRRSNVAAAVVDVAEEALIQGDVRAKK